MPAPVKPLSKPNWTLSNAGVRSEPSPSYKNSGFAASQRPTFQVFNWLLYIISDWIIYFDQVADIVVAGIASYEPVQERPSGPIDGTNRVFTLTSIPPTQDAVQLFLNSRVVPKENWILAGNSIQFLDGEQPKPSEDLYAAYTTQITVAGTPLSGGGSQGTQPRTEYRTVSTQEANAKALQLLNIPYDAGNTDLIIQDTDASQFLGTDYSVSGNTVGWNGLGLDDGSIVAGTKIKIRYFT